jgi:uncharacterized membrane protein
MTSDASDNELADATPRGKRTGLAIVFLWFFIGGLAHFFATDVETGIVPAYVPWPRAAVLASGVAELAGAAGILWGVWRRSAGWLLAAVTIAVTPVHIDMLQRYEHYANIPYWVLVARLPIQAGLIVLILWSTSPASGPQADA